MKEKLLPTPNTLPSFHQEAKEVLVEVKLETRMIYAFKNDYVILHNDYEAMQECPICQEPHFWKP
jgi:hypothetical protein